MTSTVHPKQPPTEEDLLFIQQECRERCEAYPALEKSDSLTEKDHRLWLKAIKEWNDIQAELKVLREDAKTAQEWVVVEQEKEDDWVVVDQQ